MVSPGERPLAPFGRWEKPCSLAAYVGKTTPDPCIPSASGSSSEHSFPDLYSN